MTDRDIGNLEARMDEHDRRFDAIEKVMGDGFRMVNEKLDALASAESERKGASRVTRTLLRWVVALASAGGVWEIVKGLLRK